MHSPDPELDRSDLVIPCDLKVTLPSTKRQWNGLRDEIINLLEKVDPDTLEEDMFDLDNVALLPARGRIPESSRRDAALSERRVVGLLMGERFAYHTGPFTGKTLWSVQGVLHEPIVDYLHMSRWMLTALKKRRELFEIDGISAGVPMDCESIINMLWGEGFEIIEKTREDVVMVWQPPEALHCFS